MRSPTGSPYFGSLPRDPNYGLSARKKTYRLDGQRPAGPRLFRRPANWLQRLSRPRSGASHERTLARTRAMLFTVGSIILLWGIVGIVLFADVLSGLTGVIGTAMLWLIPLSRRRPTTALTLSALLLVAHLPITFLLLARFGYWSGLPFETADPVLSLAWLLAPLILLGGEVVIILRVVAGVRSARALARDANDRVPPPASSG